MHFFFNRNIALRLVVGRGHIYDLRFFDLRLHLGIDSFAGARPSRGDGAIAVVENGRGEV